VSERIGLKESKTLLFTTLSGRVLGGSRSTLNIASISV
jgi:hypothetical protein